MVECMDKLQMAFTYYFDYDYWGLLERFPCKTVCTIMYCTLRYQYSSIIIIITNHLLGIVMWDVFKDDLFLVLQTLWSKYHNFRLHNEKPESQRHKRLVQVHTNWVQLCPALRTCVLCNVRRVWLCTFLLWWQEDVWYESISRPSSLCFLKTRWWHSHDGFHIIKQSMRIRCWPTYQGRTWVRYWCWEWNFKEATPSDFRVPKNDTCSLLVGRCPFLLQVRRASTSLGADPR